MFQAIRHGGWGCRGDNAWALRAGYYASAGASQSAGADPSCLAFWVLGLGFRVEGCALGL